MTPQEASKKYHWCKYDPATNTVELYLDHFMLSGFRICEAKGYLEHIAHIKPKYGVSSPRKPWFYDWGEYIHWCLEKFYGYYKNNKQPPKVDEWIELCKMKWQAMKMDEYGDSKLLENGLIYPTDAKKFEEIKGWEGACGLLIEYYAFYMDMRLRIIDTEITFGHNKEVYLGNFDLYSYYYQKVKKKLIEKFKKSEVKCYLTGRIDLLVDNGYKIGPIDHKNTHKFDGGEHDDFNPNDAITGYILACNEIIKKLDPDLYNRRPPLSAWIQHISGCHPSTPRDKTKKPGPRFKTTPIDKTPEQLQEYKDRNLSTFKRVAELLFNDKTPEWNTIMCNNIFHRTCEYRPIHRNPSNQWFHIINDHYTVGERVWDTRNYSNAEGNISEKS